MSSYSSVGQSTQEVKLRGVEGSNPSAATTLAKSDILYKQLKVLIWWLIEEETPDLIPNSAVKLS